MRFELQGAGPIEDPTPEQVVEGLQALKLHDRSYAILELTSFSYMQVAPAGDGAFQLEFQDGSLEQHYRTLHPLPIDDVIRAFDSYLLQEGGWRSGYQWRKMDARPRPRAPRPRQERRRMSRRRLLARQGIGLVWGLVQLALVWALFVLGGIAGALLGVSLVPQLYGLPLAMGFVIGIVAGFLVCHRARGWVLLVRVRQLRQRGLCVTANVPWVDRRDLYGRGGRLATTYTVFVTWQDPGSGAAHEYDRQYRFFGRTDSFESVIADRRVLVLYNPDRPSRFVVDIPFAPTMADLIL